MTELQNVVLATLSGAALPEVAEVYTRLQHLDAYYPDFERWYWQSVVPGLLDGTRTIRAIRSRDRVLAVLIAKKTDEERKLCTLWVDEIYAGKGLGVRLINEGRQWVGSNTPLASVPEERMGELSGILGRMGFVVTEALESFYRPGKTEYVFNGRLSTING
ncbi:hypothetical protein EHI46_00175 [Rhizobium leguminosarum]|jgi:GNAT superfamily N-acetyltransferase|uniref:hypothetical protein n=1 Tax=Rhizobium leguminosarum TaxID=384 RepID=UPI000FF51AA4|nr:hypothetical protein [Rhizobium leguminosarum]RWY79146.1 hypothetical protein EHI46_00175 [Rhizobium leguminosarum]